MALFPPSEPVQEIVSDENFMIKITQATAPATRHSAAGESDQQRFERIELRPEFKQLKAVFDNLGVTVPVMQAAIITTNSIRKAVQVIQLRAIATVSSAPPGFDSESATLGSTRAAAISIGVARNSATFVLRSSMPGL